MVALDGVLILMMTVGDWFIYMSVCVYCTTALYYYYVDIPMMGWYWCVGLCVVHSLHVLSLCVSTYCVFFVLCE